MQKKIAPGLCFLFQVSRIKAVPMRKEVAIRMTLMIWGLIGCPVEGKRA
ncbi:hypothetical protein [Methanofollis ethanolicus]|nr:hypothetical protein [Methanofollis ethanolicus]